jgi:hypothetical protein
MTNALLALYTRLTVEAESDEGQGTLEYVGIVVIAALLVAAIVAAVKGADIGGFITTKINEIKNN